MSGNGGGDYYAPAIDELEELEAKAAGWERPLPFTEVNLPPFPTKIFPEKLQAFVEAEAMATQTPTDLAGMLVLSACAAALQGKLRVRVSNDWVEPLNLYTMVALDPANRKSAVYSHIVGPIEEYEQEEAKRLGPEIARAVSRRQVLEMDLKTAQKKASKSRGVKRHEAIADVEDVTNQLENAEIPASPRIIIDDITPEKLVGVLKDHGGRAAIMSAEGGGPFGIMAGRYSKNGAPNFGVYLKAHGGDTISVDRVGRASEHVRNPALTFGLTVQPGVVRGLAGEQQFRDLGLLARFLYSIPKSSIGKRKVDTPPVPEDLKAEYRQMIWRLLEIGPEEEGQVAELEGDAWARLAGFAREVEARLGPDGDLEPIKDWAGKLIGATARVAAILNSVQSVQCVHGFGAAHETNSVICVQCVHKRYKLSVEIISLSIFFAKYLIQHALAAFTLMGADPITEAARYAWGRLQGRTEISKRDLHRLMRTRVESVDDLDPIIRRLVDFGYLRKEEKPQQSKRGRSPSPMYAVFHMPKDTLDTLDTIAEDDCPV